MDRFDPFVKYADVYGDIINWEKDPMNKPQNQNKYFFSDGKTYYEQICKMLRLMSVFKEAFNQIYSNEDEISEAWENFVNNLSASVVEGSEPDVTLTWTDDSVNFEFTMVPGVQGDPGVGITSISFNSDYTMTITLSDGNTYTSMSLKGETGPQGPQGETGSGLQILDVYATLADLQSAHPTGQPGDAYQVGSAGSYTLYIWSSSQSAWVQAGTLGTVSPYTSAPLMDGTASAGSQNLYARGDHVHPSDTSRASKEELDALIKTSLALIDQSFTYRKSPAIQDGLARIDKIKGNTLRWNQLYQPVSQTTLNLNNVTFTYADGTWTASGTPSEGGFIRLSPNFNLVTGHKYLLKGIPSVDSLQKYMLEVRTTGNNRPLLTETNGYAIGTIPSNSTDLVAYIDIRFGYTAVDMTGLKITPQLFDLTQMGLDYVTSVEEFISLFPLPYYDYDAGSLLPFNGTGLKITGKNKFNLSRDINVTLSGVTFKSNADKSITVNGTATGNATLTQLNGFTAPDIRKGESLIWSGGLNRPVEQAYAQLVYNGAETGQTYSFVSVNNQSVLINATENMTLSGVYLSCRNGNTFNNETFYPMLRYADSSNIYEPYTENTALLPISTYFPTGMKRAINAYDELTDSKATVKINSHVFNAISSFDSSGLLGLLGDLTDAKPVTGNINNTMSIFPTYDLSGLRANNVDGITRYGTGFFIRLKDKTTLQEYNDYLSANPLTVFYEINAPVETAVDLDLDFMAYEDGTEQLLPVNGSVPSTSPIIADMTYLSIDDAMEYVLEKLANVPENTQQMIESLEDDVADLQTDVGALQPAVSALQTSVGNINTNIGQLSSTVAGHTASISDMQSDITDLNTGLSNLEDTVTDNTSRIGTLETGLTNTDSEVDAIDARVLNLETDLLKVVTKEYDYESVAGGGNFGVQTGLQQEPGYKIIGIVGSEVQQGEYTSAEPWIIVTQAHIHYTSTGGVILSMMARNVSEYTKTNVRVYLYVLCIKDTQSE